MKCIQMFTHTDLDGISCAALGYMAADQEKSYIEITYCGPIGIGHKVNEWIEQTMFGPSVDYLVLITDISVDEPTARKLDDLQKKYRNVRVQLLDHHQVPEGILRRKWLRVQTDSAYCGTNLTYQWLVENKMLKATPALDAYCEDVCLYDTWRFDENTITNAERLNIAQTLLGREAYCDYVCKWFAHHSEKLELENNQDIGPFIEADVQKCNAYIKGKLRNIGRTEFKELTVGYVFGEQYISRLAHQMLVDNPELDVAAVITMPGTVSLRTNREDLNLGNDVAGLLGGGGHPKAAGYQTQVLPLETIRQILRFQ